jgi:hypothetical protein
MSLWFILSTHYGSLARHIGDGKSCNSGSYLSNLIEWGQVLIFDLENCGGIKKPKCELYDFFGSLLWPFLHG